MAIPLAYNVGSVRARWLSTVVAVAGIAGTVGVFVAVLALARGFRGAYVSTASPLNVMVRRTGASTEIDSVLSIENVRAIEDAPGVARAGAAALVAPEVVVVGSFPMRVGDTDALVQIRGTSPRVFAVRPGVKIVAGRLFRPGLLEIVAGTNASRNYVSLRVGDTLRFGGATWSVVGVFDAGGSAFDSEIWCDADVLNQVYQRPRGIFQAATVRLESPAAFERLRQALTRDPRLGVDVEREPDYYERQAGPMTRRIVVLGTLVAIVMAVGAVFGASNTMYSAVAARSREIAVLRALGFGAGSVVLSFVAESMLVALVGGLLGAAVVLPLNGLTTATMNLQTFSHVAFAFRVTPALLAGGVAFALLMGLVGGLPPALRAARLTVAAALRAL
jgi:putative ABC transport system permease protein